ncbi:MAG: AI-2E family transporter [Patescibacteria group bacterium]|nr:AI-2E family transporter [Patescibacteria group bacterium]
MSSEIRITTKAILTTLLLLFGVWLFIQLKGVFLVIFVGALLALALDPLVDWLVQRGLRRDVAVFLVVIFLLAFFLGFGALGISPLVEQTTRFIQQLPRLLEQATQVPGSPEYLQRWGEQIGEQLGALSTDVLRVTWGAFSGAFSVTSALVFTVYILLDLENLKQLLKSLLRKADHSEADNIINEIESCLGAWLRGEVFLMFIIGGFTYVGLSLLNVRYALPVALIAGLLEIVPIIGPIVSIFPAAVVGFSTSLWAGFGAVAVVILVQQLENHVIVPRVMKSVVGFNPLVTMILLLAGGKLFGIVGAFFAIPTALVVEILLKHFLDL